MDYALDKALQEMSLEDDKPIVLRNLPKYSSVERNGCSIIGRLLCPENQKMSDMIHEMPRLWRVANRARGIALPNDQFQFIFDYESDLLTVLEAGAWTYNDWSMTLERWVETPPEDYLKVLPLWIRLRHIPVNYNTKDTISEIAEHIGQVTHVAFDPLKPQSRGFVRVRVLFDVNKPLRNAREVTLPTGEVVSIGIEYERIRKRCYQCQRLTHDKESCPFNPSNRQKIATGGIKVAGTVPNRLIPKISKDDPLFGVLTNDDVGIDPISGRPKIAKEVLDEMRQYLSVVDPQEKKIRIARVRKSVWDLEKDPQGQKTLLRLEPPVQFTTDENKGKGLVMNFDHSVSSSKTGENRLALVPSTGQRQQVSSADYGTASEHTASSTASQAGFVTGPSGTSSKVTKKRNRPNQWRRKAQALQVKGRKEGDDIHGTIQEKSGEDGVLSKRKASEEGLVVSKIAKRDVEKEMRREHFPDFLFLMETKNSSSHVLKIQRWMGYDKSHIVDPIGLSGGLALFWKGAYEVEVLFSDHRIIDVKVKLGSLLFFISCVYGEPVTQFRQVVWDNLVDIGNSRDDPWLVLGDLNEIVDNTEKLGGPARAEFTFFPFRNMISDCRLREVPSIGNRFSWAGDRNNLWIQCRLDRALGNEAWFHLFPRAQAEYLERIGSDHRPVFVRFVNENMSRRGRFLFDKRWTSKPEFLEIIKEGWCKDDAAGYRALMHRLANCRKSIARWKRVSNQNSKKRIDHLRQRLDEEGMKTQPNRSLLQMLKWELAEAYREEELYWKQKSRERWLKEGDRNTKFFHGSVQRRRVQNRILSLFDDNNLEQFAEGSKGEIAVAYFRKIFSSSTPEGISEALDGMAPRVTEEMNIKLTQPVTSEEIKVAAFSIRGDSTPGADGMSGHFYQAYWDIVGSQVITEVQQFFESGILPAEWNFTQICLLPKKPNPSKMTDLRPISLCSVIYKIVSKILCARLKKFLPAIVSETQGAFVSGRLISDNILLAHEMVHALQTNPNCNEDFIAIKTDMSKAYDRVEWNFLEELLIKLGFDIKWVQWIMSCVRTVSYSVLINGASYGYIKPERGIRQGDPLSPFLFILCAEALVHIMNKAEQDGHLTGLRLKPNCPSIQHLLFADDSLFLCQATFKECTAFLQCLQLYGKASGQEINFQKSAITFGKKLDPYMRRLIGLYTGIEQEGGTDRLKSRLNGWYEKTLSLGGKEVLIKSVALALPVYAMSCFRLTKHQCQKITSAMSNFWWNESEEKHKMHWVSWEKICKSKEQGGLGFRDIGRFNQALLAKQAWRLLDVPDSLLARVYKARYYANKSFLEAAVGNRPSYAWRSIMFGKELLERGLMKTIGNGQSTYVWVDKWLFDGIPRRPINKETLMDISLRVSSLITPQGEWNVPRLTELFTSEDVMHIRSFPPSPLKPDRHVWAYTKEGHYSVKSGHWLVNRVATAMEGIPEDIKTINKIKERVWKLQTAPKIKMFLWRALSGALAVADCLQTHGLAVNPMCPLCRVEEETITHVLFKCPLAAAVWHLTTLPHPDQGFGVSITVNIQHVLSMMERADLPSTTTAAIPWLLWEIWKARNSTLYAGKANDPNFVLVTALEASDEWLKQQVISDQEGLRLQRRNPGLVTRWVKPAVGQLKCNLHAFWVKNTVHYGGAWLVRDHNGEVILHAREAFIPMVNRVAAELRCFLWCLQSLHNVRIYSCEIWSDCNAAIQAITQPLAWPKYSSLLDKILQVMQGMQSIRFRLSSPKANALARDIASSVVREGRFNSYIARGGPAWLHNRIEEERRRG
ncbi:Reverse transcriptase domain [Arabidopsis thaliana x Arabidopsis arenosa]|uniref:Reverse transcriptase domain n=1 Tax=Arabidopsis thaliana x Arabidopsis arenosa TaxID=1240361 RepID=A0A8T2C586_9BRAS|nr:Reverse transcriptase domain [Arabidopsis thaliana x Arabidopsis arenosa]